MKNFIKVNQFIVSIMILFFLSIANAQINPLTGVPDISKDPILNNALGIDNWLPGGKNDDFSGNRGTVSYQREAYSIIPLTNMKLGVFSVQNAVVGAQHYYEKSFNNHPHWVHSPFDEVVKNSSSEKVNHGSGSQTGYDMSWTTTMIHPANGYDGVQGGGYPEPVGGYDTYSVNLTGMAVATYFVPEWNTVTYNPTWKDRNPLEHWANAATQANDKFHNALNDADRGFWSKGVGVLAALVEGAASPLTGVLGIGSPELGTGSDYLGNRASELFVSNLQQMSVAGQFEAIKIGDVLTNCKECGDVITVGGALLGTNQIKNIGKAKGKAPPVSNVDSAKMYGQLKDAANGKGNFGIGEATSSNAELMGKAWVGEGYKIASDGKTLISSDGMRQYRPPTYKPYQGKYQANFEQKMSGQTSKQWQSNAHLDISDL